jgi:hypothetical protein
MLELRNDNGRALVACGMWLRVGFIGVTGAAGGLRQLFDDRPAWASALTLLFFGMVLAVAGWWRGRRLLGHAERPDRVSSARTAPGKLRAPALGRARIFDDNGFDVGRRHI